jgi:hypothetical protein
MILGLFATALGKGSAAEAKSAPSTSGQAAVLESPAASDSNSGAPSQSALAALQAAAKTASAAAPAADPSKPEAKACPQCGSTEPWGISSWCPNCFYHPRLGQMAASLPQPDPEVRQFLPGHVAQQESYLEVLKTIPMWIHVLWIGLVGCVVLSAVATLKLPKFGYERAVWTVVQASLGIIVAGTAHVMTFFIAMPSSEKHGPFDLFMKPLDFWRFTKRRLPTGAWRIWMFAWGMTAAFLALVLIGGIRYSAMFETKSTKKKGTWYQTSQIAPGERQAISVRNG